MGVNYKGCKRSGPSSVVDPCLFHDHRHDRVLVRLPALLMHAHNLVNAHTAHKVARDEHKVGRDDPVRVDVPHRVPRTKRLLGRYDGHYLDT